MASIAYSTAGTRTGGGGGEVSELIASERDNAGGRGSRVAGHGTVCELTLEKPAFGREGVDLLCTRESTIAPDGCARLRRTRVATSKTGRLWSNPLSKRMRTRTKALLRVREGEGREGCAVGRTPLSYSDRLRERGAVLASVVSPAQRSGDLSLSDRTSESDARGESCAPAEHGSRDSDQTLLHAEQLPWEQRERAEERSVDRRHLRSTLALAHAPQPRQPSPASSVRFTPGSRFSAGTRT